VVAQFLAGAADCRIVKPPLIKTFDLRVDVPVEDMNDLPLPPGYTPDDAEHPAPGGG